MLLKNYFDPWWRQPLIFYAGIAGDIGSLLSHIQSHAGLTDSHGLLDEMMAEARYTSPFIRQVVYDIAADGALDDDDDTYTGEVE